MKINIPKEVEMILNTLYKNGYDGFVVGGCVRDSLLNRIPKDWDITTNAKPDKVMCIFEEFKVIPTGLKHGTVTIIIDNKHFEVTTYRIEGNYSDNRRPDNVEFTDNLLKDLSRRDFTINSMAYNNNKGLIDPFMGLIDLSERKIRCVGDPNTRFNEDALRMLRAVRFSSQLGFEIESMTKESIKKNSSLLRNVSMERINVEFNKILLSEVPSKGIENLIVTDLINYIMPELKNTIGFDQHNPHHDKDVFHHTMAVLDSTESDLILRLAALLHDIGKPHSFTIDKDNIGHFYNHHKKGMEIAGKILKRLKYDKKTIDAVKILVKEHMNKLNETTHKSVKRLINRVGIDNTARLFKLQIADIKGSKTPHDFSNIVRTIKLYEKILKEKQPLSVKELDISGYDLIELGVPKGKEIGIVLRYLLEMVLEKPELNKKEILIKEAQILYNSKIRNEIESKT